MKIGYKIALISIFSLLLVNLVPAQEIPILPSDKSVTHGQLPNGMKYFIIENPTVKGTADFALVNRTDNSSFRKSDVRIAFSESVMDSTLLAFMNHADKASPSDQAIIVSGDVKSASVAEKIRMLSYMIPVRDTAARAVYLWESEDDIKVVAKEDKERKLATVTATWRSPRTATKFMNTIQPAITALFTSQMGMIARDRLGASFYQTGIPVTDVTYRYTDSSKTSSDEQFSISLSVAPEHLDQAIRTLSSVMASIDAGTVTAQEVKRAHAGYMERLYAESSRPIKSNREYVDRAVSAYLFNGSLASASQIYDFQSSRYLPAETEVGLFNSIASAILDKKNNLTIECVSSEVVDSESIADIFISEWDKSCSTEWKDKAEADEFLLTANPEKKMKMSLSKKDHMSSGVTFTLENGLNVLCRTQPADGRIYFSMALNGGYGDVLNLSDGEGAYVADYLYTCKVAGIPMRDFLAALAEKRVNIDFDVEQSSMSISGSASKFELVTVLQAMTLLTRSIEPDDQALDYYLKTVPLQIEALKGTRKARLSAIDAIMCPDNVWSDVKSREPGQDFGKRVWNFYADQFRKLDDGILVVSGDVSEYELRKHLSTYGHLFKTLDRTSSRQSFHYQPISGVSTYTVKGEADIIDYAMSARCPLTSDNHVAGMAAAMAVEQRLSDAFEDSGWNVEVKAKFTIHPDERFNVMITLVRADEDGMKPMEAMSLLRTTVSKMAGESLDKEHLSVYAAYLKNRMSLISTDPSFWTDAVAGRKLYGKDIVTGYSAKCDALTSQKVQNIILSLIRSGKVEYITEK